MSQEHVLKALRQLGFSHSEALIYIFLSKKGLQRGRDVSRALKLSKQQLYLCLKNLENKGVVSATLEYPARFNAAPFEVVLDLCLKAKLQEVRYIEEDRNNILSDWNSIAFKAENEVPATFMVLKGKKVVYSKIKRMIELSQREMLCVTTMRGLVESDHFGMFDAAYSKRLHGHISLRFLTDWQPELKLDPHFPLDCASFGQDIIRGQSIGLSKRMLPPMVVKDEDEILVFLNPSIADAASDDVCLWTNCKTIICTFTGFFEELWKTAIDINGIFKETKAKSLRNHGLQKDEAISMD